jgi:GPH family glycoside/pentoside/hexuronide:cation symporter
MVVLLLPAALAIIAHGSSAGGVQAMGWLTIALIPLTFSLAMGLVRESKPGPPAHHASLRDYLALLTEPAVVRLMIAYLALNLAAQITGALFFFYIEQVKLFGKGQAEALLFIYFLAALAGAPLWLNLAYRLGKHRTLALASIAYIVTQTLALLIPHGQFLVAAVAIFIAGLPYSAADLLVRSMLADAGDAERLERGVDRAGLHYALLSSNSKIASALAVSSTFAILSLVGFNPASGATNTQAALIGLQVLFATLPAALGLGAALVIRRYPLTAERHAEVMAKLAAQANPSTADRAA